MPRLRSVLLALLCALFSASAFAQGVQTGTIRGVVHDDQGLAIPGVTVTVTSPALQGPRTAVTDSTGGYTFLNLPPGVYSTKFELSNFGTIERQSNVALGLTVELSVTMKPAGISESVNVVAETPAPIATPVLGSNIKHEEVEVLATPRTLQGIAQLAPAVTTYTPNAGQLVINGSFAFDNVFMVNGVDVNDNLFATPQNLFVEDAIEETQVLTSGISAEYGRFSGGVVNAITKSGGNTFSGSGRVNFTNPAWSSETPYDVSKGNTYPNNLQESYEGTFGGPIVKDKLWFFGSGRYAGLQPTLTVQQSGVQVVQNDTNKRGEIKLTGTVAQNHTIQGGFMDNARTVTNTSGIVSLVADPHSLITRSLPNWYYYTNYKGVIGNGLLIEGQYSQRHFEFSGDGGTSTAITDSPMFSNSLGLIYNAPYFCACDPEQRNNRQITANVTKFWTGNGRHTTKGGYEWFRSQRTGGNSQSSTSYVFNTDWLTDAKGNPALDANGRFIPVFGPDSTVDYYPATIGATLNIDNHSLFIQDHWAINDRWSADLGARYEHVKALSNPGNILGVDNNRIVPRLSASWDIAGTGAHVVHLSYGQYSGRYNEALIGANSPVGNPADIFSGYQGPAGQGVGFAPGFNVANYPVNSSNSSVTVPTANIFMDPSTKSPLVHEIQTSYGANVMNGKGYGEAALVWRKTTSMIEDIIDRTTGTTHVILNGVDAGIVTNHLYENSDIPTREYSALVFQGRYNATHRLVLNGQWTVELKNEGNYTGEGTNTPGSTSRIGDYPEAYAPEANRFYPTGNLPSFERNRVRAWAIYTQPLGAAGNVSFSGLLRVDSAQVYSLAQTNVQLTSTQRTILANAGYPDAPGTSTLYFSGRGTQFFNGYNAVDLDINYDIPILKTSVKPWIKLDIYNLFNNDQLVTFNTTVRQDPNSPLDALGYRTGYIQGAQFGQATANTQFIPVPTGATGLRTVLLSIGVRF
jgi:outer membrane receptor protein involved in Fe transport